jgi:two-component system response regulator (stage 0 sporulation protein A)
MDDVQQIIAKLHITKKYGGYYYSIMGIRILLDNPDRRLRITKDMYPPIAAKYGTTDSNVAHGITTVVQKALNDNRSLLEEMAGYTIEKDDKMTNMEFLSIVADYIERSRKLRKSEEEAKTKGS